MAPEAPDGVALTAVGFEDLPGWRSDRHAEARAPLLRSCRARLARPGAFDRRFGGRAAWRAACAAVEALPAGDDEAARAVFERWFAPRLVAGKSGPRGLFTGYYEPELAAAPEPGGAYREPLYARPDDLVTVRLADFRPRSGGGRLAGRVVDGALRPYFSRAEIAAGALAGRARALYWAADPVAAFFLHVQGSGRLRLPGGARVRLGYAAANGRPYTAIGKVLVERGALARDDVSLQSISAWLRANPGAARAVMDANESYVFFRVLTGPGPVGSQGVPLTAGRSLAVDARRIPLGLPLWLDAPHPLPGRAPLRRLVVAQDTGGAIRGAVRGDLFWGAGEEAEAAAGRMRSEGRYFALVPRPPALARAR